MTVSPDLAALREAAVAKASEAAKAGLFAECRALDLSLRRNWPGETRALFALLSCALEQRRDDCAGLLDEAARAVVEHAPGQRPLLWQYAQLAAQTFSPLATALDLPPLPEAPLVSVVIPTLGGRAGLLDDALQSVAAQSYPHWEALVVNATPGELACKCSDSRLRFVAPGRNLSAAAARNVGLETATGDLIAFLDDDDLWHPEFLAQAVARLRSARLAAVFGNCELVEEELAGATRVVLRRHAPDLSREFSRGLLQVRNYIANHELVFRRAAIAGLRFAEDLQVWEDWEFALAAASRGPIGRLPTITGEYRRRISGDGHVSHSLADFDRHFDFIYARHPAAHPVIDVARGIYRHIQLA